MHIKVAFCLLKIPELLLVNAKNKIDVRVELERPNKMMNFSLFYCLMTN